MIICAPRTGPRRCALCHDALDERTTTCRACGAAHHLVCVRVPARCATCSRRLIVRWRPARVRAWPRAAACFTAAALSIAALLGVTRAAEPGVRPASSVIRLVLRSDPERTASVDAPAPRRDDREWDERVFTSVFHAPCAGCRVDCFDVPPEQEATLKALLRARDALTRLGAEWPDWRGAYEDDLLVAAPMLGLTRLRCSSSDSRWTELVSRVLAWLVEQGGRDGSFPGDGPAQARAIKALEAVACTAPHSYRWPDRPRTWCERARALARALTRTPAESWSPPRTWRDLALDPRPGTRPLRLDPARDDVQALLRTLVATQRADGTWTRVAQYPREERPELATAVNALLLACALFEPDGTLSRGRE